jgi:hypothetical protein
MIAGPSGGTLASRGTSEYLAFPLFRASVAVPLFAQTAMALSARKGKQIPPASAPVEAVRSDDGALLLIMRDLGGKPSAGRLLRGLIPYLDDERAAEVTLYTERQHKEPWSGRDAMVPYWELVHWVRGRDPGTFRGTTWKSAGITREEIVAKFKAEGADVVEWAARRAGAAVVSDKEPLVLQPCFVDKPWGREVWYTGIEKRGRSLVRSDSGTTELPYALGMFPVALVGMEERAPILLKALEPLPQEVLGDLYLEVHQEKWEVYVVLDVNPEAWPDGVGRLRSGLSAQTVIRYKAQHGDVWEQVLSADLLAAIRAYEDVRRRIDSAFDTALAARKLDPAQGVPAALYVELSGELPADLRADERRLRQAVESFLGSTPMPDGAVACLPPGVLHSLQHGVKVIEFQTPTYERLIAMFAQKVLTQKHWDSEQAVARMQKSVYTPPAPEPIEQQPGWVLERIVQFPGFQVQRLSLEPGASRSATTTGGSNYQLLIGVLGEGSLDVPGRGATPIAKETALLLPAALGAYKLTAGAHGMTCLVTLPGGASVAAATQVAPPGAMGAGGPSANGPAIGRPGMSSAGRVI